MRAVDVIVRKRDGFELTRAEIEYFINGFATGEVSDYQAAAWAMAVLLNGMTPRETGDLTMALVKTGETLDLSDVVPVAVDKHSTGGVGDKTTLVVGPVVAACGLPVGKMSGRGLGFSGGTLDKMESIPGYRTDLTTEEFLAQLRDIGIVLTGQSVDLAPGDGKMYALRDVTGTVPSLPLIASSVMSKKIAAGAQGIVLDVKVGLGAFMETLEEATELAELMVAIARQASRQAVALLSDMNQPLGYAVGNALEVKEAIETLQGGGPADFLEHCLVVSAHMLRLGGKAPDAEAGRTLAEQALANGDAWARFRQLVQTQGGDVTYLDQPEKLPQARMIETLVSPSTGFVHQVHARIIGELAVKLGAGRAKKEDPIDHGVGIVAHVNVGDQVASGDPLFTIHAADELGIETARRDLLQAVVIKPDPVDPLPVFYGQLE